MEEVPITEPEVKEVKIRSRIRGDKPKPRKHLTDTQKAEILSYAAKELPVRAISDIVGVSKSRVQDLIKRFKPVFHNIERIDDFRTVKSDILAASQLTVLESAFTGNKLRKASFLATIKGFAELNKAERLERNESTENIAHRFIGPTSTEPVDIIEEETEVDLK